MRLYWNSGDERFTDAYLVKLLEHKKKLHTENQNFFSLLMNYFDNSVWTDFVEELKPYLLKLIKEKKLTRMCQIFEGEREEVLVYILGEKYASLYNTYLRHIMEYPYRQRYAYHPIRSNHLSFYLEDAMNILRDFLALQASGLSDDDLLAQPRDESEQRFKEKAFSSAWWAAKILAKDTQVIQYLKSAISDERRAAALTDEHFRAIAMGNNRELLEMEAKLLLLPQLPDDIRKRMLGTMVQGRVDFFLHLYKVIRRNNLIRFPSVKKAITIWIGLDKRGLNVEITDILVNHLDTLLEKTNVRVSAILGSEGIGLYLALWATGFYGVEKLDAFGESIIRKGQRNRMEILFFYLQIVGWEELECRLAVLGLPLWHKEPLILAIFFPLYLEAASYATWTRVKKVRPTLKDYFKSMDEVRRHYTLLKTIYVRGREDENYHFSAFSGEAMIFSCAGVVTKMCRLAYLSQDQEIMDDICGYLDVLDGAERADVIKNVLKNPTTSLQIETVIRSMNDRNAVVRSSAFKTLDRLTLKEENYRVIEDLLRSKSSDMRVNAIHLLMKQVDQPQALGQTISRLLTDKSIERRLAGLDLTMRLRGNQSLKKIYDQSVLLAIAIAKPSVKEKVLIEQLSVKGEADAPYTRKNGFGLCDPSAIIELPEMEVAIDFTIEKAFDGILSGRVTTLLMKLDQLVEDNKNREYASYWGESTLLGKALGERKTKYKIDTGIERYPFPELWSAFYRDEIKDYALLLQMEFLLVKQNSLDWEKGFGSLIEQLYKGAALAKIRKTVSKLPHLLKVEAIVRALEEEYHEPWVYQYYSYNLMCRLSSLLTEQNASYLYNEKECSAECEKVRLLIVRHNDVHYWLDTPIPLLSDEDFKANFTVRHLIYRKCQFFNYEVKPESIAPFIHPFDFGRAYQLELIPEDEVIRELLLRPSSYDQLSTSTDLLYHKPYHRNRRGLRVYEGLDFSRFIKVVEKVVARVLDIELVRGDSPTEVTSLSVRLQYVQGIDVLIRLAKAIGKGKFTRGLVYYSASSKNKKEVISHLLRCSHPFPSDNASLLREQFEKSGLTEKQLIDVALYAPQWLPLVEEAIGWKGLTSVGYFLYAHINDSCDEKTKAVIARYTPGDVADLQGGALDLRWLNEVYEMLGQKRFELVYAAARNIAPISAHTRFGRYIGAMCTVIPMGQLRQQIRYGYNQEDIIYYSLIPLGGKKEHDLLERYRFLEECMRPIYELREDQNRRELYIALQNLACCSGYGDAIRLCWNMEAELFEELTPFFIPKEIDGIEVYMEIDKDVQPQVRWRKDGQMLNTPPASPGIIPYIDLFRELERKWKYLYMASKSVLERAMKDRTQFSPTELKKLEKHPAIWPLLKDLVFISGEAIGFFSDGVLLSPTGQHVELSEESALRIAHPVDLQRAGVWQSYRQWLTERSVHQVFEQVFREVYAKEAGESEATHILRYVGKQVLSTKAIKVLAGQRWKADYRRGMLRLYAADHIIAYLSSEAAWYDIRECEWVTLGIVCFYNQKDGRPLNISEVPDLIFSETMRDVSMTIE